MRWHFKNDRHESFYDLLTKESEKRDQRALDEWIEAERKAMFDKVNAEREGLGKTPVSLEDVERVEQRAVGHFDYAPKFALYCTELVENTP